jgi:hypothetical protein
VPPERWTPPVSGGFLPRAPTLSLSLPSGVRLSAPVSIAHSPLFPLCLAGSLRQTPSHYPCAPTLSLATPWDRPASPAFPAPVVDQRAPSRTFVGILGHVARPCPQLLLSTAHTRTLSPIPFRTTSLSLALYPRRSASPETRAHRAGHPTHRKPRQATPSSAPR